MGVAEKKKQSRFVQLAGYHLYGKLAASSGMFIRKRV